MAAQHKNWAQFKDAKYGSFTLMCISNDRLITQKPSKFGSMYDCFWFQLRWWASKWYPSLNLLHSAVTLCKQSAMSVWDQTVANQIMGASSLFSLCKLLLYRSIKFALDKLATTNRTRTFAPRPSFMFVQAMATPNENRRCVLYSFTVLKNRFKRDPGG